jgi:hydroxymethylpyrimidine/phosphomethylpyrimidine kinase
MRTKPIALTIAGSDSGGGAGIQADIKSMEANGVFAASALTAVTAQNSEAVTMAFNLPGQLIAAQIDAVASDFDVAAAKTGMLSSAAIIEVVAAKIEAHDLYPLVVDPVMVSKSGFRLLEDDAIDTLRERLIPRATVVTPNAHEAAMLAEMDIETIDDAKAAAEAIYQQGPEAVVVKGGHLRDGAEVVDVFFDGQQMQSFTAPRVDTENTHGTGCTYASAIAAHLAKGSELATAIERAKQYVTGAIRHALPFGRGHGPTNHFFHLDPDQITQAIQDGVRVHSA